MKKVIAIAAIVIGIAALALAADLVPVKIHADNATVIMRSPDRTTWDLTWRACADAQGIDRAKIKTLNERRDVVTLWMQAQLRALVLQSIQNEASEAARLLAEGQARALVTDATQ